MRQVGARFQLHGLVRPSLRLGGRVLCGGVVRGYWLGCGRDIRGLDRLLVWRGDRGGRRVVRRH